MNEPDLTRTGISEDRVPGDEEFEDLIVKKVTPYEDDFGWSILSEEGSGFGMPRAPAIDPPEPGDRVRLWGTWGSRIHGMALRGVVVYYRTIEEDEAKHAAETAEKQAKDKAEWEASGKAKLQARYEKLPPVFQARLDKYRNGPNPNFGWQFESYEMFCCEQAAAFAARAHEAVANDELAEADAWWAGKDEDPPPTPELRWFVWWSALASEEGGYARQKELMPALDSEHSGNTFGSACNLAVIWLRPDVGDEGVVGRYGSLAPLVGSEAYGDPGAEEETAA